MFEALNDVVLLEPLEKETETKTKSGLILPENTDSQKYVTSKVISAGQDVANLKAGDTVLFQRHTASEIAVRGHKILAIFRNQLVAKIVVDGD